MSVNGYINIEITTDAKYEEEARRWAKKHYYTVNAARDGKLTIDCDGDVSYFDFALDSFANDASELRIPASEWKAEVHYTCEEGACDDGGNVHVTIEDGKIASFKQSRIEMVEVEPWARFELGEMPEPEQKSPTGFRCPKCGQTGHFTASAVVVATRVDITPDGWDYWSESGNVELYQNALMTCCECGHTAMHNKFEEEPCC